MAFCTNEGRTLRRKLTEILKKYDGADCSAIVYSSFDIVGDIAITKLPDSSADNAQMVAGVIMNRHRKVKTVLVQESKVCGKFRLRRLTCIGGENRTHTLHKESMCAFSVDLQSCYFSPRLSGERLRIAQLVQPNEVIVNMFAGVGCFSIVIAKRVPSARVFSIDLNPSAYAFMQKNIGLNRVYGKVTPLLGDSRTIIQTSLKGCADRVLMPLPEKAYDYLPDAVSALKPSGGWIHVHTFEHATKTEDSAEKVRQKVKEILGGVLVDFEIPRVRIVRSTGPHWWQLVADIRVRSCTINRLLPYNDRK